MLNAIIDEISVNERLLLSDIKFKIEQNKIYSVLGSNGSGKTTLIKSLSGLLDKRFYSVKGKVFYKELDLLSAGYEQMLSIRRKKIKYVFQDAVNSFDHLKKFEYYFKLTAGKDSELENLLDYFLLPGVEKLFRLYPYEVCGGMAQRISFVLALLADPEILILDEPTSGIDSAISNLFLLKLKEFASIQNHTALLVTHDIKFAKKISDEIAFISKGKFYNFVPALKFFENENIIINNFLTLDISF